MKKTIKSSSKVSPQTFGKSLSRAKKHLPKCPERKVQVLTKMVKDLSPRKRKAVVDLCDNNSKQRKEQDKVRKKRCDALTNDEVQKVQDLCTSLKQFQLDAICAIEKRKMSLWFKKLAAEKAYATSFPLCSKTNKTVVICPTISLFNSQLEGLHNHNINGLAAGPHFEMDKTVLYQEVMPPLIYTTPKFFEKKLKFSLTSEKLKLVVIDSSQSIQQKRQF